MDFRAAYLPDKYWHRRSILVPKRKVILDERFLTINDIFHNETERQNFEIYWVEYGVYGNVRLIGELNYCYLDGKYYHLEKVRSQGFVQNGQIVENVWDYYMEYDDWMNDWLNDKVDITGTINKTGNINQVNQNIVQIAPLIQGQNTYQTFNSHILDEKLKRIIPYPEEFKSNEFTWLHPELFEKFNRSLNAYRNTEVDNNRLIIPMLITRGRYIGWESTLINELIKFLSGEIYVYDLKKTGTLINFNQFKTKYNLSNIYTISSPNYTIYEISQSVNQHIRVKQKIDISNLSDIKILSNTLVPDYRENFVALQNVLAPYLEKYTNLEEKSRLVSVGVYLFNKYFGDICCNDKHFKKPRFLQEVKVGDLHNNVKVIRHTPDRIYWEHPDTGALDANPWWENYLNNFVFTQRIISRNFIYEPGTPKLYIAFLRKIGKKKLLPGTQYSIGKDEKYPPKTPAYWFNTTRIDELMEWLTWLNNNPDYLDPTFNSYSDNPISLRSTNLTGNLILLDNSAFKFINGKGQDFTIHEGAFMLLPDYREKTFVLADGVYFDGVKNLNVIDYQNPTRDIDENHTYTLIKEMGIKDQETSSDWKKPKTDELLNNSAKYYEKYAIIIPLIIKWTVQNYKYGFDSYGYRFKYEFWRKNVYIDVNYSIEATIIFQFPLIGCGFDIYGLLKEYTNPQNKSKYIKPEYLHWGFLADEETKKINNWEDRPPRNGIKFIRFTHFYADMENDAGLNYSNESFALKPLVNELIEIHLFIYEEDPNLNITCELLTRLWVYYFGFRWDGSHNGAILKYIGEDLLRGVITYIKPFNHRYYGCRFTIRNSRELNLNLGNSQPIQSDGDLLYGKGSYRWNPDNQFNAIGWQYVYGGGSNNKRKARHDGYLLSCLAQSMDIAQNPNSWESFGLHQTGHLRPDKFAYLLKVDKPWEYIKFTLPNPPPSNPFENLPRSSNKFVDIAKNKVFKTKRYLTPERLLLQKNNFPLDVTNEEFQLADITYREWQSIRVPRFLAALFNPSLASSKFHNFNFTNSDIVEAVNNFGTKFEEEIHNVRTLMESTPFLIDLVGTEFIAVIKIGLNNEYYFELVSKTGDCFEKMEITHHQFILTQQEADNFENTVKRVNSNFEVSVFGQRFPLKTRPKLTGEHIDIGLRVIPINDPKQSETSLWFMMTIQTQQDVQKVRIEVPKELTAMHNQSPYEREDILRKISYHAYERNMEIDQFNLDKEKYRADVDIKGRRMDIDRNREITSESIQMGQTMISGAHALAMTAGGWGATSWIASGATIAGTAMALAGQSANMAFSKQLYDLSREEHAMVSSHGMRSLENRGLLIAAKHQDAQASERLAILNMQHNVSYPANSDALMYREENKQFGLTDIHLIRYYPEGDQLRFLVNYYKEYGFNVIVPNVRCLGASWIHDHIQYVKITSNAYENETIKRMIEERALNGITMVDNDDWHADRIKPNDDLGDLNEDAKQLYTNQEN